VAKFRVPSNFLEDSFDNRLYNTQNIAAVLNSLHSESKAGSLERLEPAECLNKYATSIQSNRRHLLLVAGDDNFPTAEANTFINGSHVYWAFPFFASDAQGGESASNSYNWICSAMNLAEPCSNNVDRVRASPSTWRVGYNCTDYYTPELCALGTFPVEYCLSQQAEPHCRLQFDTTIAITVTVLNFGKYPLKTVHRVHIMYRTSPEDSGWRLWSKRWH
jgi:hypothetical protein